MIQRGRNGRGQEVISGSFYQSKASTTVIIGIFTSASSDFSTRSGSLAHSESKSLGLIE